MWDALRCSVRVWLVSPLAWFWNRWTRPETPATKIPPILLLTPVGWWWASVLVTMLLNRLIWLYQVVTSDGGTFAETAVDTRTVAYPLWTAGTVMTVVTAFLSARVVRRITEALQRTAETRATGPA